jgi:hypothetical protein
MIRPPPPPPGLLDQLTPLHWAIGGLAAGVVLARFGGPLLRRLWFRRYLLNVDSGEYQRWTHTDRHGPLVDVRTHELRRGEAAVERRARLRQLWGYGLTAGIGAAILAEAYYHSAHPFGYDINLKTSQIGLLVVILLGFFVAPITLACAGNTAWALLWELAYLTGLQGWRGARVLDPPAPPEQNPWDNDDHEPPFGTGGPADPRDIGELFGNNITTKPKPKFKD